MQLVLEHLVNGLIGLSFMAYCYPASAVYHRYAAKHGITSMKDENRATIVSAFWPITFFWFIR